MTTPFSAASCSEVIARWWRGPNATRVFLVAGIVAMGVYVVGDVVCGLLYDGYSWADQAISELTAYGSPVRPLMVAFIATYGALGLAFAVGLWRAGAQNRALRWVSVFLLAAGVFTLPLHPFFPMSSRWMEGGFNDTMHQLLTGVYGPLVFLAVVAGAVAYRGWFRLFSIATLVVIMAGAAMAWVSIQPIARDLPTPWAGAFERINAYVFMTWIVVLAVTVLGRSRSDATPDTAGAGQESPASAPTGSGPPAQTKPRQPI